MATRRIDIAKWVTIGLTIIGLGISAVVWASSEHDDLKDNYRQEVKESEKDMKQTMKEQYVPLHEFTKIEQKIDNQTQQIDDNANKIEKIDENIGKLDGKIDTLLETIIRNNTP